jgi:hypothetical protein
MASSEDSNKNRSFSSGIWKEREFIKNKIDELDMNEVNSNKAWALCKVQQTFNICSEAILGVISEYGVSKSAFYRAKRKIKNGGVPGGGKCSLLSPTQWKNVEEKIVSKFEKGTKTEVSKICQLVFIFRHFNFF